MASAAGARHRLCLSTGDPTARFGGVLVGIEVLSKMKQKLRRQRLADLRLHGEGVGGRHLPRRLAATDGVAGRSS